MTTPLLKLYAELVYNKAQRLTFDSSSPNGILLFRDASAVVVGYGRRDLEHTLLSVLQQCTLQFTAYCNAQRNVMHNVMQCTT